MKYFGHVENGAIVLDEPACLKEGMRVRIEFVESEPARAKAMPFRGTPYAFEDPFSPAVGDDEWDSVR